MHLDRLQLTLPLPERRGFDPRDFIRAASNQAALTWLEAGWPETGWPETGWPENRLAIWGPEGCGKSHLLHVWAERRGATIRNGPALLDLDWLPDTGVAALDDADLVAPDELLLHTLNTARDRGLTLLLTGRSPPSRWPYGLPDLRSRLRALTAIEIGPPDDALLGALLVRLLAERQLSVPAAVQSWLLARLPRSAAALRAVVVRLDRESLMTGKAITRMLASDVLRSGGWLPGEWPDTTPSDDCKTQALPATLPTIWDRGAAGGDNQRRS